MNRTSLPGEINPVELKSKLDAGEDIVLLDVREPRELEIATLENTAHIPCGSLQERVNELAPFKDKTIVVYCRSGGRSHACTEFLRSVGYQHAFNLTGGILAWADDVDPSLRKY
jgi:sulfur-carrier protein adenylyltransferase/sulfurtransferase